MVKRSNKNLVLQYNTYLLHDPQYTELFDLHAESLVLF